MDKPNGNRDSGKPRNPARRRFVERGIAIAGAAGLAPDLLLSREAHAADASPWGWPLPYKQVSEKSVAWLKSKGWWPLQVGWNPLWSDGNVVLFAMQHYKLLQQIGEGGMRGSLHGGTGATGPEAGRTENYQAWNGHNERDRPV